MDLETDRLSTIVKEMMDKVIIQRLEEVFDDTHPSQYHNYDCLGCKRAKSFTVHEAHCQSCNKRIALSDRQVYNNYFDRPFCENNDACKAKYLLRWSTPEIPGTN